MNSLILSVLVSAALVALIQGAAEDISCNFEVGYCGWTNTALNQWIWANGNSPGPAGKPERDVTLSSHSGHYLYSSLSNSTTGTVLLSPTVPRSDIPRGGNFCFRFSLFSSDAVDAAVRVTILENGQTANDVKIASAIQDGEWRQASVEFNVHEAFQIQLEGILIHTAPSDVIAIDDLSLQTGHCH